MPKANVTLRPRARPLWKGNATAVVGGVPTAAGFALVAIHAAANAFRKNRTHFS